MEARENSKVTMSFFLETDFLNRNWSAQQLKQFKSREISGYRISDPLATHQPAEYDERMRLFHKGKNDFHKPLFISKFIVVADR